MAKKLSDEEINIRLLIQNRNIFKLDEYINSYTKIRWKCKVCNYIWLGIPNHVMRGSGCPKCTKHAPITNEDVDKNLMGRNIERIDDVNGVNNKINWKCTVCYNIWLTTSYHIIDRKHGCPRCSKCERLTDEIVDRRLKEQKRKLIRIGNVVNALTKIKWKCEICNNEWLAHPNHVLNVNSGCPKCSLSKGELRIENWLTENRFKFKRQYTFSDCKNPKTNYRLRFDFAVFDNEGNLIRLIEYDGRDHFPPSNNMIKNSPKRYNLKNYENRKYLDSLKDEYAKNKMLRISYLDGNNINEILEFELFGVNYG